MSGYKSDISGYRALWAAVMLNAFSDLKPRGFLTPTPKIKPTGDKHEDERKYNIALSIRASTMRDWDYTRESASRWMFSGSGRVGSFLWICDALDLDARALRSLALSNEGIDKVLKGKLKLEVAKDEV